MPERPPAVVTSLSVLVADGTPLLRSSIALTLERRGGMLVRQVGRLCEASVAGAPPAVDAAVLCVTGDVDALVGPLKGLVSHGIGVLVIGDDSLAPEAVKLMMAGASGYLSTAHADQAEIIDAVHHVAEGRSSMHPAVAALVLQQWRASRSDSSDPVVTTERRLTDREQDVLQDMVAGRTPHATARTLGVSLRTVHTYRGRLDLKLGVRTEAQAVAAALDRRLVRPAGAVNDEQPPA